MLHPSVFGQPLEVDLMVMLPQKSENILSIDFTFMFMQLDILHGGYSGFLFTTREVKSVLL